MLCGNCHKFIRYFRYTIIGVNVGFCVNLLPELFTSLFSDSITTWIRTIVESDGDSAGAGAVGTGMGRVEFSICKEVEEPPTETTDHDEVYEVGAHLPIILSDN